MSQKLTLICRQTRMKELSRWYEPQLHIRGTQAQFTSLCLRGSCQFITLRCNIESQPALLTSDCSPPCLLGPFGILWAYVLLQTGAGDLLKLSLVHAAQSRTRAAWAGGMTAAAYQLMAKDMFTRWEGTAGYLGF